MRVSPLFLGFSANSNTSIRRRSLENEHSLVGVGVISRIEFVALNGPFALVEAEQGDFLLALQRETTIGLALHFMF